LGCDYGLHGFHIWYGKDNQRKEMSMSYEIVIVVFASHLLAGFAGAVLTYHLFFKEKAKE
jgi:hypothetical protein